MDGHLVSTCPTLCLPCISITCMQEIEGRNIRSFQDQCRLSPVHLLLKTTLIECSPDGVDTAAVSSECYEACATLRKVLVVWSRVEWWRSGRTKNAAAATPTPTARAVAMICTKAERNAF